VRIILLGSFFLSLLSAQQTGNVVVQPDCVQNFTFTANGSTTAYNAISSACLNWNMSYESTGFSALSLVVETAPNNGGVPGSWTTFTAASGSNPNTTTTSASSTFAGFFPFIRITLSSSTGTGTIKGTLYGYKNGSGGGSGGGGGSSTITNFTTCNNGSNTLVRSAFTFTASGNTQIVAASGSTTVTVCGIYATTDAATFLKLTQGTGANCGTGTTDLTSYPTGTSYNELGFVIDFPLPATASNAVCISSAAVVNGGGVALFVRQ
jgi:hypothetical protein